METQRRLCKENKLDEALDVFCKAPDRFAASALIKVFSQRRQDLSKALDVYHILLDAGERPDIVVLSALVAAGRQAKQTGRVLSLVLEDINRFDIALDDISTHPLAAACGETNDASAARTLLEILRKEEDLGRGRNPFNLNVVDCRQLCKAMVSGGDLDGAFDVLASMIGRWGIRPSSQLCAILLSGCAAASALDKGKRVHAIIIQHNITVDTFVATGLITMYSKCGMLGDAMNAFDDFCIRGIGEVDVGVWTAMMAGYTLHGHPRKALALYDKMCSQHIQPDSTAFLTILPACGQLGALTLGKEIHAQIIQMGIEVDDFLGAALINMYGRAGGVEEAASVFASINQQKRAGVSSWNAMIGVYGDHIDIPKAMNLFEEMVRCGVKPDGVTCCIVLNACSHGGLINEALHFIESMKLRFGVPASTVHHNCVIDALGQQDVLMKPRVICLLMSVKPMKYP